MKSKSLCFVMLMTLCWLQPLIAQIEMPLRNPSFEGIPLPGRPGFPLSLAGWKDCAEFPKHSPADIHSVDFKFWGVTTQPYAGTSYLGLVTRPDGSYECIRQELSQLLKKGKSYILYLSLCRDENYSSKLSPESDMVNFEQPAIIRIWGSNYNAELLAVSVPVAHTEWREYNFEFVPSRTFAYLSIEAYFANDQEPGAGHVLVDDARLVMLD